ncbi:MAG: hypothetical protein HQ465_00565, partial [Rhodospirillales bacterium]|nr:hypothetical protein [Rhodospirillales bacterium]
MRRLPGLAACLAILFWATAGGAQGPRLEPTPGGLPGPSLGGAPDTGVPPSVPTEPTTPDLIVDLSRARVSITSAFQGESILLFGMFDPPGEI